jgi:cyclopropane fatty-acyl-phospholipid synthase-like methyltransferase
MNWHKFWQDYRPIKSFNNEDFLYQIGKTVNGIPISNKVFFTIIEDIKSNLDLNINDNLLDLCCGNGILTKNISNYVNRIIAIDFSEMFIRNAVQYNKTSNIEYFATDVLKIDKLVINTKFSKVLIYDALASFTPETVKILLEILDKYLMPNALIMFGAILDNSRKFKFYNTLSRIWYYLFNISLLHKDNGIGRWWKKEELEVLALNTGFFISFIHENPVLHTAHYRFDCVFRKK